MDLNSLLESPEQLGTVITLVGTVASGIFVKVYKAKKGVDEVPHDEAKAEEIRALKDTIVGLEKEAILATATETLLRGRLDDCKELLAELKSKGA